MDPQESRIPFPLDMLGDLDTTLRYVEDKHLAGIDAPETHEHLHPLATAIRAIKAAIQAYRAKAAQEALSIDDLPIDRDHLATVMDFARIGDDGEPDQIRAAGNVSEWLDRDI
ncbi:hypothetical protein [Roseomonas fluvialis]|uniref:Uncharacterized protein n=1 Tax=Roseomonas fluvialis TaxID=1750527 RepID=A0ABN6P1U7_9PROT|nr:hypothetical protein [Roseomonas fluvialis]BDG72446.1 hypothetical protein Rmf_23750 [Roseomonas fluvialis]